MTSVVALLKKSVLYPTQKIEFLKDDNRLGGYDSVPASGEDRVEFQKVPGCTVSVGGVNKKPGKVFGNTIINSISNSSCTTVQEVPAETINSQPLLEKRLQQQSSSRSTLQGGTKLVDIKPKSVKWEVSSSSPSRNLSLSNGRSVVPHLVELLTKSDASKTGWGLFVKDINRRSTVSSRTGSVYKYTRTVSSKICNTFCR